MDCSQSDEEMREFYFEDYDTIPSTTDVTDLTFESRSKPSGSSVQIPLTLSGIDDKIGNMDITLSYDPSVLEATEVIKGDLLLHLQRTELKLTKFW